MRLFLTGLLGLSLAARPAVAQNYSGTYTTTNEAGGTITLSLLQDAQGQVSGTMSADGVQFGITAVLDEGSVLGTLSGEAYGLYFTAEFDGVDLYLTVFEADANNQPNYDEFETIVFKLAKGASRSPGKVGGSVETGLPIAFGLPRILAVQMYFSRYLAVEAVYQATIHSGGAQMGRIVNTGTLSQGLGGQWQYSPQPSDRLVVNLGAEQTHEFVIQNAQGNTQAADAMTWLMSPHVLQYVHRLPGKAEGNVAIQFDGSQFEVQVQGWQMQSGTRYDVNLRGKGKTVGSRDFGGQNWEARYTLTGTITGGGVEVEVNEQHTSAMGAFNSPRALPSRRGSSGQINAVINNVARIGGAEYRFQNVQVKSGTSVRGQGAGRAGVSGTQGHLLLNGAPFGPIVYQGGRSSVLTGRGVIALDITPNQERRDR